jgi:hypothetical protein
MNMQHSLRSRPTRTSTSSTRQQANCLLVDQRTLTNGNVGSMMTPNTDSMRSPSNNVDEHDYELTRQLIHDLVERIQSDTSFVSFTDMFINRDDTIACLLRIFHVYADDIDGIKRITRERMLTLLDDCKLVDSRFTSVMFINVWTYLRKQMLVNQVYERKIKTLDFVGFMQLLDMITKHLNTSKDHIIRKIVTTPIYDETMQLKDVRERIQLGLLPSMEILVEQCHDVRINRDSTRSTSR